MKAVVIALLLLTAGFVAVATTPTASACSSNDPVGCVENAWNTIDRTVRCVAFNDCG